MRSTGRARWVVPLLVVVLAAGCGTAPTPTPAPTPTEAPTPNPVAYADTLRIGVDLGGSWRLGEGWNRGWKMAVETMGVPALTFGRLVYSGLYRYDGRDEAVPDLADGPCFVPGADGRVIRCRLVETTFHDGTPLTADDVAYSYRVFASPVMGGGLPEVRVVDDHTVDFVLSGVDAAFMTTVLPLIPIFSRRSIDEAVAAFDAGTKDLTAEGLDKLAADIDAEINADPPVCSEARLAQVDGIYRKLGFPLYHEDALDETGTFDACSWLDDAALNHLDNSGRRSIGFPLTQTGIDRVAGILDLMTLGRPDLFVGTGPYRYVSQDADSVHFEAFAGYHGGVAATRYVELCIDLPRNVDAATFGFAIPIYGPVLPGTWGDDPDLPKPERDVAAARRPIEASGWTLGPDGVYARGGVRLAAEIPVRGDAPDRVKMVDLIATQARDCGMGLRTLPLEPFWYGSTSPAGALFTYPHYLPGTETPFDLMIFRGAGGGADPANGPLVIYFHSSYINDAQHPDNGQNFGGFSDPAFDHVIDAANATYDQEDRARLLREAQEELAAQVPAIFLWADTGTDALRTAVATVDGPLDLTLPNWAWQPERMVVTEEVQ